MTPRTDTERLDWFERNGGMWEVYQESRGRWYVDDDGGASFSGTTFREAIDKCIDADVAPERAS